MAASPESINELRRQLAESRARLARTTGDLEAALDVPARIRQQVSAHPVKWALLAVAGGVVAARALPLVAGLVRTAGSRRLLGTVLTTVGPLALKAGLNALATHRPDLAAILTGHPGDRDAAAPESMRAGERERGAH